MADKYVDSFAADLVKKLAAMINKQPNEKGGVYRLGLHSITVRWVMGSTLAATPDGRLAKDVISKNLCASNGMDRRGVTAYMSSVIKMDLPAFLNAAILDFYLHPSSCEGEKGLSDLISLIKVYFSLGGVAIQGNVLSGEKLKEAIEDPEKYKNLQVRVCGWNEYFVKMTKAKQEMFIKQFEGNKK